jgi:hypothetical protein
MVFLSPPGSRILRDDVLHTGSNRGTALMDSHLRSGLSSQVTSNCQGYCQTVDGGAELVCPLNLWRMELFKYMKVGQAAVERCRHHTVATRRL